MCALGEGEEGGEGGREQRASQRLPYPSAELPELRRGGGGREGKAKAGGLGAARAGSAARRGPDPRAPEAGGWLGERPPAAAAAAQGRAGGRAGGGSPGLAGREVPLPALALPRSPGGGDRGCGVPANL